MADNTKQIVLLILDGFGVASPSRGNAISQEQPKNLNFLLANYPAITLQASGPLVGLPWGEMGNSEVGHLNIGAGRIVSQDQPRITSAIQSGEFFKNRVFLEACEHVRKNTSKLHLVGMVSTGGVHSLDEHLYALLGLAKEQSIQNTFIHMITDGRDTEEKIALTALEKLHRKIEQIGVGKIATVTGRFYAMDRGLHWQQTEMTYQAMVNGIGQQASTAIDAVAQSYAKGIFDEMILPTVITENGQPVAKVVAGDAVIFFNFRQDRAAQLTLAFVLPERMDIETPHQKIENLYFVTMTSYMPEIPAHVAFTPLEIEDDLAHLVAKAGLRQFHAAESEKFAHVTSFFNGGKMDPLPNEERIIISSPDNTFNYMDRPEMSVEKLGDILIEKIKSGESNLYVVNFANADMVGHTGNLESTKAAVHAIDEQLLPIAEAVLEKGGVLFVTADHGNAEIMINTVTGNIDKDHTTSPVPLIVIGNEFKRKAPAEINYDKLSTLMPEGALSDIAPTILELLGLEKPAEMTGVSLIPVLKDKM